MNNADPEDLIRKAKELEEQLSAIRNILENQTGELDSI